MLNKVMKLMLLDRVGNDLSQNDAGRMPLAQPHLWIIATELSKSGLACFVPLASASPFV